jgi:hypothetical protein
MRPLVSAFTGAIVALLTFASLWSLLVVPHHSYGGESKLSQISGTILFFFGSIFPVFLAAILVSTIFVHSFLLRRFEALHRGSCRIIAWSVVCASCFVALLSQIDVPFLSAMVSGLTATISGGFVYQIFAREPQKG